MSRLVFGVNPVLEALRSDREQVGEVLLAHGRKPNRLDEIIALARGADIKVRRLQRQELERLTGSTAHQGVAARVGEFAYTLLNDLLARPDLDLIVMLDGIQDPQNLGAIARSALAAGAQGLIIPKNRAVGVTPAVVKVSAGALAHLPVCRATNLNQTALRLKEEGFWLLGASPEVETSLYDLRDLPDKLAVVIGAEGKGISRTLKEKCDFLASLPLAGPVASLNASAAAAVVLFEIRRRRLVG